MKRGPVGRYEVNAVGGENIRPFVLASLPPRPQLDLTGPLLQQLERAHLALGRLDCISVLLPDPALFVYAYVRKEAVLSSLIEGMESSLSDLLLFELNEMPGAPQHDVTEVSNYVAALDHGLVQLREGFPVSNRLLQKMHGILLANGRGNWNAPGEFRRTQNSTGGRRSGNAHFASPTTNHVTDCMSQLERFLYEREDGLPVLLRAGLAHAQFETIHPFLDGNGRVGRLLIPLLMCHSGLLREPLLYLSLYFNQHRDTYDRLLHEVMTEGDWEAWLTFFLAGVEETANGAVATAQRLTALFASDRDRIVPAGRRAGSMLRIHEALKARPVTSLPEIVKSTGLSAPTAGASMDELVGLGIARELTGRRRNRAFAYDGYIAILNEGTEKP